MNKPGIVFMGTPEFAVASLDAIVKAGYNVKGVVTAPDKPSGRGLKLHPSPVKQYAQQHNLAVLQPLKLKDPDFLQELRSMGADLQVIVAFRMLPEEVWNMPRLGTFNLHASLLPQYRGAAPINWAVMNGEPKTGVTTFFLNNEIDKGSILYTRETVIGETENAGDIHDRLMAMGAELVVRTIDDIYKGIAVPVDQQNIKLQGTLRAAPKIFRDDCRIIWNNRVKTIHDFIRGLSPHPVAWSEIVNEKGEIVTVKIFEATRMTTSHALPPGTIVSDGRNYIRVAATDGFIDIAVLQLQAKRQMAIGDFLRGFPDVAKYKFI